METRLLKGIINPSMAAVWILGPLLAWLTGTYLDTWLQIKFVLVVILSGVHGFLVRCWRDFQADRNSRSARFYRVINEVPALLMVLIVILVIVQPFE
jgi:putative membrane protein